MPVIVLRHGERIDYIDRSWVGKAERPWDPPLTGVCVRDVYTTCPAQRMYVGRMPCTAAAA